MATSPSDEEVAAVAAAVEALWPRPVAAAGEPAPEANPWKFSGRWWLVGTTPAAARRRRP